MLNKVRLSVALATYNESNNIKACLETVKDIADEIVVVDGKSTDGTADIARKYGAKVIKIKNNPMFHINKMKAVDASKGDWVLLLDADERVTAQLADDIKAVINMSPEQMEVYQESLSQKNLFKRHQKLLETRDGAIGKNHGFYVAFFIPRPNYFLGKYLRYGGTYPDGVIRLFKKGYAYLPCKSVHEQFSVDGRVGWLASDLLHISDPTFARYLTRNSRYIDRIVEEELKGQKVDKNIFQLVNYCLIMPMWWFLLTQVRHKGVLDGIQGIIFSFFSALRFPRAYIRYLK